MLNLLRDLLVELPFRWHGHGPVELVAQRLGEDLLNRHLIALAPRDRDTRVHVVDLGCTERDFLVVVLVLEIHLHLVDLRRPSLNALGHLVLGRHLFPQVGLLELGVGQITLHLLGLFVGFRRSNLLLVRLGLLLHLLGLVQSLLHIANHRLLRLFDGNVRAAFVETLENVLENLLLFLERLQFGTYVLQLRFLGLADGALMIAQNGNFSVRAVVLNDLFRSRQSLPQRRRLVFAQLLLKRLGSIVRTKHFGRETVHELQQTSA